ncbi:MAG: TIM barrel protein [Planctomycetaceae bacterium]|nr:TIM barrel protein [Planctomycetaceae bacterium]
MQRREFLSVAAAAGATAAIAGSSQVAAADDNKPKFRLKYAPHFGMFKAHAGDDPIEQLKFMADQGFTALEDNGMRGRSVEEQEKIAKEMSRLGMTMGVFVATGDFGKPTFASGDKNLAAKVLEEMKAAVEIAKRVNAKWCTVVPGKLDHRQEMDYQTANVIELLKRCAEIVEPHGLVMVLEPLNPWRDHPELFLTKAPQGYLICRAVNSPSCKILFDIYHQQITEGNLIPNIEKSWSEIGYFQTGDNPGRKEPTTGEINYTNVFKYIHGRGFDGVLGMEHGNSKPGKEGELAVIEAYRQCDKF